MAIDDIDSQKEKDDYERWEARQGRRKWHALLWLVLLGALAFIVFLPRIASTMPIREWLLNRVNMKIAPREVTVADWKLRWLGGQEVRDLRFAEPTRGFKGQVATITVSSGLLRLLPYRSVDAGVVTVQEPLLYVDSRALTLPPAVAVTENALALTGSETPPGCGGGRSTAAAASGIKDGDAVQMALRLPVRVELRVVNGRIMANMPATGVKTMVEALAATVRLTSWDEELAWRGSCRIINDDATAGAIRLEGAVARPRLLLQGALSDPACRGALKLQIEKLDMETLHPLLSHLGGETQLRSGVVGLAADVTLDGARRATVVSELNIAGLSLAVGAAPPTPAGDVKFDLNARYDTRGFEIKSCELATPWVAMDAAGRLEATATAAAPLGKVTVTGGVDIVAVTRDFRALLKLDDNVRAEQGSLAFGGAVEGTLQARSLTLNVATVNPRLFYGSELIKLQPTPSLALDLVLPYSEQPELRTLDVALPFARISGSGRLDGGTVSCVIDLTAMSRDYRKLIPACPPMIGQVLMQLAATRAGDKAEISAAANVDELIVEVEAGKRLVVHQADLNVKLQVPLVDGAPQPEVQKLWWQCLLEAGTASGRVERVYWAADKMAPVVEGISAAVVLDIEKTLVMCRSFLPLPASAVAKGRLLANVTAETSTSEVATRFALAGHGLKLQTTAWDINEPRLEAEGRLAYNLERAELDLRDFKVVSKAVQATVAQWLMDNMAAKTTPRCRGAAAVTMDLESISRWQRPPLRGAPPPQMQGRANLRLTAANAGQDTRLTAEGKLEDLAVVLAPRGGALREKSVTLRSEALLRGAVPTLTISQLAAETEWLKLSATGELVDLRGRRQTRLSGTTAINYNILAQRLAAAGFNVIGLSGEPGTRPFNFAGNLGDGAAALRSFAQADGRVGVGKIKLWEVELGASDASFHLDRGLLKLGYKAGFGGGVVRLEPTVQIAIDPPVAELDKGVMVLDKLPLTQDIVDSVLAMVNPLLRGCLLGGGTVDLQALETRIPLGGGTANQSEAEFSVTLNDTIFTVAGVLGEALELAGIERRDLTISKSTMRAVCRNGRIETSPFEIAFNEHKLRLYGTVGLDQTVAYTVELPLGKKLVGSHVWPYIQGLTIRVPITGTVTNLRLNREAGKKEIARLIAEATLRAVEQLQKLLQK